MMQVDILLDGKSVLARQYSAIKRFETYVGLAKTLRGGLERMPVRFSEFKRSAAFYSADFLTYSPDRVGKNGSIDITIRLSEACEKPSMIYVFGEHRTYFTVDVDGTVEDHFRDPEPYTLV